MHNEAQYPSYHQQQSQYAHHQHQSNNAADYSPHRHPQLHHHQQDHHHHQHQHPAHFRSATPTSPAPHATASSMLTQQQQQQEKEDGILFIGDLARNVKEEELHALFSPYGTVIAIDIKRDKITSNNLGFGFIQFASRTEAQHAKKMLNGSELNTRKIRIGWAQKNTTLFIGDLDGSITTDTLISVFEVFGPIIQEESFVKEPSRKYGFVRFGTREDAERAKSEMNHKVLGSRPIRIGWGDSNFEKHCVHVQFDPSACHLHTGNNVNSIFTEQFFLDTFSQFSRPFDTSIINISLPKHNHTKKLKGFAFIHYEENEQGEKAAILALQTLTSEATVGVNTYSSSTTSPSSASGSSASSVSMSSSNSSPLLSANSLINPSNPMQYVHHLQQSFSPRQGVGHHAPPSSTPNNNTQQHVLGGIPVKYSFGKRQIFSRHKRGNNGNGRDDDHYGNGHHNGGGSGGGGGGYGNHHNNHHNNNRDMPPIPPSGMNIMQQSMNSGRGSNGQNGYSQQNNYRNQHGGGNHGGYNNRNNNNGGGYSNGGRGGNNNSSNNNNSGRYHTSGINTSYTFPPPVQPPSSSVIGSSASQHGGSRYHTNPSSHPPSLNVGPSPLVDIPPALSPAHAAAQAQAAAATSWMIQSLAAQQYSPGMTPLSIQQVQQTYQQIHQQHQAGEPRIPSHYSLDPAPAPAAATSGSPDIVAEAATNLATAANAFFNAQTQLYYSQQQPPSQIQQQQAQQQQQQQHQSNRSRGNSPSSASALHHSHSPALHANSSSMHHLLTDMSSLRLNNTNGDSSPRLSMHHQGPIITSGHSTAVSSPTHQSMGNPAGTLAAAAFFQSKPNR